METVDVSAALIFRDGKLLITRRHDGAHLGGLWEFPGGKREAGETFEQCLARELREELAVEVAVGPVVESFEHVYPGRIVRLKFFVCRLTRGEPQALGCSALAWIGRDDLDGYAFPAADARLIEKLRGALELWETV